MRSVWHLHSFLRSGCRTVIPGVLACVHLYMLLGRWKLHETGVVYACADKNMHGDWCYRHYSIYLLSNSTRGVHMHLRVRIWFICTVQSLYCMRVYHRCFLTPACVGGKGFEVGSFSSCPWSALQRLLA